MNALQSWFLPPDDISIRLLFSALLGFVGHVANLKSNSIGGPQETKISFRFFNEILNMSSNLFGSMKPSTGNKWHALIFYTLAVFAVAIFVALKQMYSLYVIYTHDKWVFYAK